MIEATEVERAKIDKISSLSRLGFLGIRDNEQLRCHRIIVQVLERKSKNRFYLVLSDGYLKEEVIPYKNLAERLKDQHLEVGTIVEAVIVFYKRELMILLNYRVIYDSKEQEINTVGSPITYQEYVQNGWKFDRNAYRRIFFGFCFKGVEITKKLKLCA